MTKHKACGIYEQRGISTSREEMIDLSVIIVSWNVKDLLRQCLESIFAETRNIALEVWVIDNASSDGTSAMVKREFPNVYLIANSENLGFARASNQGIRLSRGRYILLLNPDTIVQDGALDKMVAFLDSHPAVGALGCKILDSRGQVDPRGARRLPTLLTELGSHTKLAIFWPYNRFFGSYLCNSKNSNVLAVEALSGACMMVRSEVAKIVGVLDEMFHMYGEDIDWCYRIRQAGWIICYYPSATIVHFGGQSSRLRPIEMALQELDSTNRFFWKHYGAAYAAIHRSMIFILTVFKLIFFWLRHMLGQILGQRPEFGVKVRLHFQILRWIFGAHVRYKPC